MRQEKLILESRLDALKIKQKALGLTKNEEWEFFEIWEELEKRK